MNFCRYQEGYPPPTNPPKNMCLSHPQQKACTNLKNGARKVIPKIPRYAFRYPNQIVRSVLTNNELKP